jgi:hypothetical protein
MVILARSWALTMLMATVFLSQEFAWRSSFGDRPARVHGSEVEVLSHRTPASVVVGRNIDEHLPSPVLNMTPLNEPKQFRPVDSYGSSALPEAVVGQLARSTQPVDSRD